MWTYLGVHFSAKYGYINDRITKWTIDTIDLAYICGPTWPETRERILGKVVNLA